MRISSRGVVNIPEVEQIYITKVQHRITGRVFYDRSAPSAFALALLGDAATAARIRKENVLMKLLQDVEFETFDWWTNLPVDQQTLENL